LGVAYDFTVASVEKQIAEAEVDLAKQWKDAVRLERSGADTREVRLLLARLEDAQLRRIQRRNMLREAVEVMARVFEPYFRTKPAGLGSGLGLSRVYGFASQSGGGAVLASTSGEGTAITSFLPRAGAGSAMAGEIAAQPASAPDVARILLVEDDQSVAEATQDLLHDMGFDTRWAGDGTAALAFVESDPKLALVLSDVVMPDENGIDLERRLRALDPRLKIILVSGYPRENQLSGVTWLQKPVTIHELAAKVREVLDGL